MVILDLSDRVCDNFNARYLSDEKQHIDRDDKTLDTGGRFVLLDNFDE